MTSHLRTILFLSVVSLLTLSACSNSLTTRGENQTIQSIDEAFPDIDGEIADADTEDLSDEGLENFDEFDVAEESGDIEDTLNSEEDFGDVADTAESNELEDFSDFDFEESDTATTAENSLDLDDDDLTLEGMGTGDESLSAQNTETFDEFDDFDDSMSDSTTAQNQDVLGDEAFEDFEDSGDFVTKNEETTTDDPFSDFLNEDLETSVVQQDQMSEGTPGSDDPFSEDLFSEDSGDIAIVDPQQNNEEPLMDSSPSLETAFEESLDNDFVDTIDKPISDDVLFSDGDMGRNKLTVLEYNAQGSGAVVLKAEQPLEFTSQYDSASSQFIISVHNITVPSILQRPLYLKDFKQDFGAIKATPVSGGLVQVVIKVNNHQEPNILTNGKEMLVSPGTEAIAGKVSTVSEHIKFDESTNVEAQISKNLNIPMTVSSDKSLTASSLEEFLLETGTFYGDPINLQVNEEEVTTVIGFIADYSGANIVIAPGVSGKITIKLRNVPWDQALLTIMKTKGLGYVRTGNVLRIAPLEDLQKEAQAAVEVRKSQVQVEPTLLKIIPLEYASSEEILPQVTPFLTKERGSATEDKRTSSIIINDTKTVITKVSKLIKELDLPPPQVLIEAKIVEATKTFARNIGVRWNMSGTRTVIAETGGLNNQAIGITPRLQINETPAAIGLTQGQPLVAGISFGILDFLGNIDATIGLSEQDDQVRVISSPRITTLNNVEATITQSSELIRDQVIITPGSPAQITPVAVPMQLQLKVTPQITSGSSVLMQLDVKNEFPGNSVGQSPPPKNSRQATAKVLVETNKTAVIGGIYDKQSRNLNIGVPMLKNLPLVGWLFKTKVVEKTDTEVMIFVTPRILDKNYQTTSSTKM